VSGDPLATVERAIAERDDADDVLRAVVDALVTEGGCVWAGIAFAENGELMLGPEAGTPEPTRRERSPVVYNGDPVAELAADGCGDASLLARVAALIGPYCLVGWDTGGVPWDDAE